MGEAFSASTSRVDPSERIAFWNAGSSRIGGVRAVALSDVFDAEVSIRKLDQVCVYRLESTPHRVTTNGMARGGERMVGLRYQQAGSSMIIYGQRSFRLNAGDWMMADPHLPHCAINEGDVAHLWLQVPCNSLAACDVTTAVAFGHRLPMSGELGAALRESVSRAIDARNDISPRADNKLASELTVLVRKALSGLPAVISPTSRREEVARRARAYIDRHLQDPDLSVEQVAKVLGCTSRYLHKIFEGSESVSRYIWNKRLDLCRSQMAQQPDSKLTLTDLAFEFGFNSSSHFSRSFRDRFGTTPSAYLARMQRA
jgi:AraC family transcriptional activator of tynA and feaB